jgi:predicted transcriptional regulator
MRKEMTWKKSFVLSKNDKRAARLFNKLGMSKNLAKTLMYLSHVDECYSVDIEQGTELRQPEVSLTMREITKRGWAKKHDQKMKEGKGRPRYIYKPKENLSEILKELEKKKLMEIETVKEDISELKHLVEN